MLIIFKMKSAGNELISGSAKVHSRKKFGADHDVICCYSKGHLPVKLLTKYMFLENH